MQDEGVEACRAAFAGLRHGKTALTPLKTHTRASGSDTTSAMPVDRGAAAMQEGVKARAARMAAAAQLNAKAMKRAELVADEAIMKNRDSQPGQPSKKPAAVKVNTDNQSTHARRCRQYGQNWWWISHVRWRVWLRPQGSSYLH